MTTTPALDQRVLDATVGALELCGIYLGTRLNLYASLSGSRGKHSGRAGRHRGNRPSLRP